MKKRLLQIACYLADGTITEGEARSEVLRLFGISDTTLLNIQGIKHRVDTCDTAVWYCDKLQLNYQILNYNHIRITDGNNTLDIFKSAYHWLDKDERGSFISIPNLLKYVFKVEL